MLKIQIDELEADAARDAFQTAASDLSGGPLETVAGAIDFIKATLKGEDDEEFLLDWVVRRLDS